MKLVSIYLAFSLQIMSYDDVQYLQWIRENYDIEELTMDQCKELIQLHQDVDNVSYGINKHFYLFKNGSIIGGIALITPNSKIPDARDTCFMVCAINKVPLQNYAKYYVCLPKDWR